MHVTDVYIKSKQPGVLFDNGSLRVVGPLLVYKLTLCLDRDEALPDGTTADEFALWLTRVIRKNTMVDTTTEFVSASIVPDTFTVTLPYWEASELSPGSPPNAVQLAKQVKQFANRLLKEVAARAKTPAKTR